MITCPNQEYALPEELIAKIDLVLEAHDCDGSKLIGILLDIQEAVDEHYIPEAAAYYVADRLKLKITAVYDAISFYSALSAQPRAKFPIQVCHSVVCNINNNDVILPTLKDLLGIELGQVTYDGKFTIEAVPCFGACDIAPAVRINGRVYGHLTSRDKIINMLDSLEE